jgi:ActR/RegA family two-component response regulator
MIIEVNQKRLIKMKANILIVEDDKYWQDILFTFLENLNYNIDTAKNLNEAINKINNKMYHFIVTDMNLSDIKTGKTDDYQGWKIIKKVKRLRAFENTPVMVVTGYNNIEIQNKIKRTKYLYLMSKADFDRGKFLNIIKEEVKRVLRRLNSFKGFEVDDCFELKVDEKLLKVKILIFQLKTTIKDWVQDEELLFHPNDINKFKEIILSVLELSNQHKANLVVFPELSVPIDLIHDIQKWSEIQNTIIVAGSHYHKVRNKTISRCPVIYNGKVNYTEKIFPSPNENYGNIIPGKGLGHGEKIIYFKQTIIGNFIVLICSDHLKIQEIRYEILKLKPDFIIVLAFQKDSEDHHLGMGDIVNNDDNSNLFYVYSNNYLEKESDGKSALFGLVRPENRDVLKRFNFTNFIPKGKLIEFKDNENYFIIEIDTHNISPIYKKKVGFEPNVKIIESGISEYSK